MHLSALDWIIVVVSLGVSFVPAIVLARRAGRNITEFFAAGRAAPWWLIGISLVATTFSTDTPNLVTNLVRDGGVAENWLWWSFLLTGMATVFFYARLWRRSRVLTDLEFYELRYAGRAASFVRGFRAIYLGLFFNCWIIATVNLALVKIAGILGSTTHRAENALPAAKAGADATKLDYNLLDLDATVQHVQMPSSLHENVGFKERRTSLADALKSAVEREPQRLDLRMKLLETYYAAAATNRQGFLDTVQKIAQERATLNAGEWDKIAWMGRQIASDEELFAPVAAQPDEEDMANCA